MKMWNRKFLRVKIFMFLLHLGKETKLLNEKKKINEIKENSSKFLKNKCKRYCVNYTSKLIIT